jgi:hypothetical protein
MSTKSITYSAGETVNMGNFNSIRRDVSVTRDIEPGEEPEEAWKKLQEAVDNKLQVQLRKAGKR